MINRAVLHPWEEGLWLTLMLLTPLLPIIIQASRLVTDGLLALQPEDYPFRRPLFTAIGMLLTGTSTIAMGWWISTSHLLEPAIPLSKAAELGRQLAIDLW